MLPVHGIGGPFAASQSFADFTDTTTNNFTNSSMAGMTEGSTQPTASSWNSGFNNYSGGTEYTAHCNLCFDNSGHHYSLGFPVPSPAKSKAFVTTPAFPKPVANGHHDGAHRGLHGESATLKATSYDNPASSSQKRPRNGFISDQKLDERRPWDDRVPPPGNPPHSSPCQAPEQVWRAILTICYDDSRARGIHVKAHCAYLEALSLLTGLLQFDIGGFWNEQTARAPVDHRGSRSTSSDADSTASYQETETQRLRRLVASFAAKFRSTSCSKRKSTKSGRFPCTFGCGASHNSPHEWDRHEQVRQPQGFWICKLCRATDDEPRVYRRKDKILVHLREEHKLKGQELANLVRQSKVEYEAGFDRICTYRATLESEQCGCQSTTWQDRKKHWISHFSGAKAAGGDDDDEDDSDNDDNQPEYPEDDNQDQGGNDHDHDYHTFDHDDFDDGNGLYDNGCMPYFGAPGLPAASNFTSATDMETLSGALSSPLSMYSGASHLARSRLVLVIQRSMAFTASAVVFTLRFGTIRLPAGSNGLQPLGLAEGFEASPTSDFLRVRSVTALARFPASPECQIIADILGLPRVIEWFRAGLNVRHIRTLGRGAYGLVDEVQIVGDERSYARKTLKHQPSTPATRKRSAREVKTMLQLNQLNHPNIARLIAAFDDGRNLSILMTPVAEYNLRDLMNSENVGSDEHRHFQVWLGSIASALDAVHSAGFLHKDVKPANILVKGDNVTLADFGISTVQGASIKSSDGRRTGTPKYSAPEVGVHGVQSQAADVWSLGCVFSEMITFVTQGSLRPLKEAVEMHCKAQGTAVTYHDGRDVVMTWLDTLTKQSRSAHQRTIVSLCAEMLAIAPERRPTASAVMGRLSCASGPEDCAEQSQLP
jgi:hypothetical protein